MNDPHGIVFDGTQYHCTYQFVPGVTAWQSDIAWGHAVSSDLVHWSERAPVLTPIDEVGCWSGSIVYSDGLPHLFYTRPTQGDWQRGTVVLAVGDAEFTEFVREAVVIDGPPSDAFFDFRDPQVRRDGDGWRMTIGAGQRGVGGCALQYSSSDLRTWHFDGILASRLSSGEELESGTVWECPQFVCVDGHWVLLVSAMTPGEESPAEVLYAIGEYDGMTFAPRVWGRFGHSRKVYATTTFTDHEGRVCAMSWLREFPRSEGQAWEGAQSLVHVLRVVDDRLVVEQHPNLDSVIAVEDPAWRFTVHVDDTSRGGFCVDVDDDDRGWSLVLDWESRTLHVSANDAVTFAADMRVDAGSGDLDLVVDAGIAECTWSGGEGIYVFAVPNVDPTHVDVTIL